uniref:Uncharacterized protein n=1 Tax=Oryza sativa subsp. japonica TaxID=39947 RepID=Q69TP2_ORYSJ|nr:hypothetical protein [Oryza sativa Japonica Group]BAD35785.1 hypothetical protein [Oryza sativa Japonica Group]
MGVARLRGGVAAARRGVGWVAARQGGGAAAAAAWEGWRWLDEEEERRLDEAEKWQRRLNGRLGRRWRTLVGRRRFCKEGGSTDGEAMVARRGSELHSRWPGRSSGAGGRREE